MNLGERLRREREKKGWTQLHAAKVFGITNGALSNYERNYRMPDASLLHKFASIYDVTIDYLLGRTNNPKTNDKRVIDLDLPFQEKTLADALLRIAELDFEYNFDDQTLFQLVKKAREKYGLPGIKGAEPAAHGPNKPGSGAFDEDNKA